MFKGGMSNVHKLTSVSIITVEYFKDLNPRLIIIQQVSTRPVPMLDQNILIVFFIKKKLLK